MALPSSGPISASGIRTEFGASGPNNSVSLGNYRVKQSVGSGLIDLPLDTGIPQGTAAIGIGSFIGKKLNIVVNCTSNTTRVNARSLYDANTNVTVIGGFKSKPATVTNQKVWIHTNGTMGSDQNASAVSQTYCTLFTGTWDSTTDLYIDIGPSGNVMGAGGNGGGGGSANTGSVSGGGNGGNGTSAIGIIATNNIVITNRGRVAAGGGGGGGGGGAEGYTHRSGYNADGYADSAGSGGGGGAGSPAGSGVSQGSASCIYRCGTSGGNPGGNGTTTTAGSGGDATGTGGGNGTSATGGAGGTGGTAGTDGNNGGGGSSGGDRQTNGDGGTKGSAGYAYVVSNNGTGVSITNTGTVLGSTAYSTIAT